ncbi:MAG: hypothetical protein QNJ14_00950 [Woeseiaceae bacterium]|nr:hypothetical protein [Woeseiaceae bacterium]
MKRGSIEADAFGLVAWAGAAAVNVKQRQVLQKYLESGDADHSLAYLGETRESLIDSVDRLFGLIRSSYYQTP